MRALIVAAALSCMFGASAAASTYSEFNGGVAAFTDQLWDNVIAHMSAALAAPDLNPAFRATAYYDRAAAYAAQKKYDLAVPDLDAAIAADGTFLQAYLMRGGIYELQDKPALAIADFSQVIAQKPQWDAPLFNRALIYMQTENHAGAIADLSAIIQLDPREAAAYEIRGMEYRFAHQLAQALDDFNTAAKLAPNVPGVFAGRAAVFLSMGDWARAKDDFDSALRLKPDDFAARAGLGFAQWALGAFDDAHTTFQSMRGSQNHDIAYFDLMLWAITVKTGSPSVTELRADLATMPAQDWPRPVVDLVLGTSTPDAVMMRASEAEAAKRSADTCEARFYVAIWREAQGDKAGAVQLLSAARDSCPVQVLEGSAAAAELKRLQ